MTENTPFWGPDFTALQAEDPDIAAVVLDELERLRGGLQLIAGENFTGPAVLGALGSTQSNKYAEGYPGRRYYGGCEVVDRAEEIGVSLLGTAIRDADGSRTVEVSTGVRQLVGAHPAYPHPAPPGAYPEPSRAS